MNAFSHSPSHAPIKGESMQRLACWLKSNGGAWVNKPDARLSISQRYPAGLLSDAELEALVGIVRR